MLNQPNNNQQSRIASYQSASRGARLTLVASIIILIATIIGYLVFDQDTAAAQSTQNVNSSQVAVVRSGGAELQIAPGGNQLQLPIGTSLTATGRSADGRWFSVYSEDYGDGWVEADQILVIDVERLPVMSMDISLTESADSAAADVQLTVASASDDSSTAMDVDSAAEVNAEESANLELTSLDPQVATVSLTSGRLNVRSGPGINYPVISKAEAQERLTLMASNEDGSWVQIQLADESEQVAWVSARYVTLGDGSNQLPLSTEADGSPAVAASSAEMVSSGSAQSAVAGLSGNLIFQSGNGGPIYVYSLNTGNLRMLTTGHDPAVSPDGKTVAFTRYGHDYGLYLIETDGSNERLIFTEKESIGAPSWSPDGQWILFSHQTGEFGCRELFPGICFKHNRFISDFPLKEKPEWGLGKVDRNGEQFRDLPALNTAYAADWTDAGIVYQASTSIEITHDTAEYEGWAVMNQKVGHEDPDWQPGGGRIVFQDRGVNHTEIWSANPDGSGLVALTRPETTLVDQMPSNVSPAWSPDGAHIVYLSNRDADEEAGVWRLWIMDADGGNKQPLPIDAAIEYNYGREQVVSWGR